MAAKKEEIFFQSRSDLRSWLTKNSKREEGIWAIFHKKSSGISDLSWDAIVEECLCFGWIDSLPGKVDDSRTKIYITPRKKNSGWSKRNKRIILDLEDRGLMTEAGRKAIDLALSNGSWNRFDMAEDLVLTQELLDVFENDKSFASSWRNLTDARKRQYLQQIYDAKREETRLNRILKIKKEIK